MVPLLDQRGGRAFGPGPRRFLTAAAVIGAAAVLAACGASKKTTYGGLPSFLPKSTVPVNRIVTASAARPQLAVQGATVAVVLPAGGALATVVGPALPPFVLPQPLTLKAVFTITLAQAHGTVPIRISDFSIKEQSGKVQQPQLVAGTPAPPADLPAGGHVTFKVTAVLPSGEGLLRWSPGGTLLVGWDFIVEND